MVTTMKRAVVHTQFPRPAARFLDWGLTKGDLESGSVRNGSVEAQYVGAGTTVRHGDCRIKSLLLNPRSVP